MVELILSEVLTHEPLAVLPKKPTAPMQTPMISANMTAYSTAVGPLSSRSSRIKGFIAPLLGYNPLGEAPGEAGRGFRESQSESR
jgi:hypothetical protein